jgi:signal transduction histidine kinase
VSDLRYSLLAEDAEQEILVRTCLENRTQIVREAATDPRVTADFRARFGVREFVCVPLSSKGRVVGVLLADNLFSSRPIHGGHTDLLELFAATAGLAVDNARTYAELKTSLDRLEEAQDRLLQTERLATVGSLAAHVAHEIRNPLTTIGGFARAIHRSPEDDELVRERSGIIVEEVVRLETLLSEVMDFTRPARPTLLLRNVNDTVQALIARVRPEVELPGVELVVELDDTCPPVLLDGAQLRQALLNLVRNATESLTLLPEGAPRRIVLRTASDGEGVRIEVEDCGPGIPEDLLPTVFKPFVSRKTGGTGLGLAVVRQILIDHGGDAIAGNAPGGGALFTLSLPLPDGGAV